MAIKKQYDIVLNALGDPTRRAIFEKLVAGPLSVAHIAEGMDVTRPAVSQHLKVLKEAKLISMEQQGTRSIYRIDQEGLIALRNFLDRFWGEALQNLKRVAEELEKKKTQHNGSN
ncbi:MAG TPA: metalloregulator ArsR/SmtB family transcription factor [Puia sp.]|nr:metalloregulator ArsR/SmtB family transcription factor [Puia sp.]